MHTADVTIGRVRFEVEFERAPGRPARLAPDPYASRPAEGGEVDIQAITLDGTDLLELLDDRVVEVVRQQCMGKPCQ